MKKDRHTILDSENNMEKYRSKSFLIVKIIKHCLSESGAVCRNYCKIKP